MRIGDLLLERFIVTRPGTILRNCFDPYGSRRSSTLPDLLGPNGDGVLGQVFAGSVAAAIAAYVSVRFLTRYFSTRTLTPFAIYCLVAGALAAVRFAA